MALVSKLALVPASLCRGLPPLLGAPHRFPATQAIPAIRRCQAVRGASSAASAGKSSNNQPASSTESAGKGDSVQVQQQQQGGQGQMQGQGQGQDLSPAMYRAFPTSRLAPLFSDVWDPTFSLRSLRSMMDSMDRVFEDAFTSWPSLAPTAGSGVMPAGQTIRGALSRRTPWDVKETDDAVHLRVDMPGFSKDEVSVRVEDENVLVIRGEHQQKEEGESLWRTGRQTYQTSLVLPDNVKVSDISAELKNGVLEVFIPKVPEAEAAKVIHVDIK